MVCVVGRPVTARESRLADGAEEAELLRHRKGDAPSKEEAELWAKAADTCDQIISHSRGLRDLRVQWESRKQDCLENVKKIADLLAPLPPKEPKAPPAAKPAAIMKYIDTFY